MCGGRDNARCEDLPCCLSASFGAAHDTKNTIGCCVIHAVIRPLGDVETVLSWVLGTVQSRRE